MNAQVNTKGCPLDYLSLDEIHAELLNLLETFDQFAHENDLRYSLDAGTLLGAVRHGGFIPWDDDLDVIMPRPDFERMIELAGQVPADHKVSYVETDGTTFPFVKFVNQRIGVEEGAWRDRERFLWLDVFPADGMSDNDAENQQDFKRSSKLQYYRLFQTYPSLNPLLNVVKTPIRWAMDLYSPARKTVRKITELATQRPFEGSTWCRDLVCANNPDARIRTEDFSNLVPIEFCGKSFLAVPHWDEYLTSQYGDYMQLPPEDQRTTHHVKAWRID